MRDHAQKNDEETEINMTPMLDIVFIMLIFFIVTAVFVKEAGINVIKPAAESARIQKQVSILIAVTPNDLVYINREPVDPTSVRAVIEKLHSENPKGTIAIQADEKAKAGIVMAVYDAVREAGVPRIALATEVK